MLRLLKTLLFVALFLPLVSHAWWDKEWPQRTKIVLNTSGSGASLDAPVSNLLVALRLHSGNFDFASAKEDGSDLRLVAGDDKTPLQFHIERFDGINEMALLWVQIPTLAPASDKNVIYAYAGNPAAVAEAKSGSTYDGSYLAVWHFGEKDAPALDATKGGLKTTAPVEIDPNGVLANAANLNDTAIVVAGNEQLKVAAAGAMTVSLWIKPTSVDGGTLYQQGALQLGLQGGKLVAAIGKARLAGGEIKAAAWQAVTLSVGNGKASLYLDGVQVAQGDAVLPEISGDAKIGAAYAGLLDELNVASVARSADYLKATFVGQGNEGKLLVTTKEAQGEEASEEHNYFGVLVGNLTTDAWVVIAILMVMFVISCWVMVSKTLVIGRVEKANLAFLRRFREVGDAEILNVTQSAEMANSSLFRLYDAGIRETNKRFVAKAHLGDEKSHVLSGASIDAIKASIDADQVRENHKLNSLMVLLTIAISGGPFLGLLGTVVGVMITFAAIAAAGDVNVNAIAPGIAAALLATVAGLGVAIPALFGYNWLAAKIKNISADMQIFVDELVTRIAEIYGD
ncbi:DUF2341 domain-containing protein [Uliginosibacterium flavum]|uniref:DUF2341 domain-containing protein n=1 Tax=Uliginosibacterium flavum TaxID=1396831 RepID=A0ABV2TIA8_9RHOO